MPGPSPLAVALDAGGTKVAAALVSGDGQVLARADPLRTPGCGGREFTRLLAARARELAGRAAAPITAAGVSVAGRVEPGTGVVEFAPHLPGSRYSQSSGASGGCAVPGPVQAAAALCYPGTCLMEGTNLSVGRGTTTPFELIGAPWVTHDLARRLRAVDLPGVAFREAYTVPQFDRFAGQPVCGVQLHVTDRRQFEPLRVALEVLAAAGALWPEQLTFSPSHFDRLAGSARLREALESGTPPAGIVAGWEDGLRDFARIRAAHLRYDAAAG